MRYPTLRSLSSRNASDRFESVVSTAKSAPAFKSVQAREHDAPGGDRGGVGIERREPAGDRVRVDELRDDKCVPQEVRRGGGLACAVGAAKHDEAGSSLRHVGAFCRRKGERPG
jgi:hypothetical protein